MAVEKQEGIKTLSPFERLRQFHSELPKHDTTSDIRGTKLDDDTEIAINPYNSDRKRFVIRIYPKGLPSSFSFSIDDNSCLDRISDLNFNVRVGSVELSSEAVFVKSLHLTGSKQERLKAAKSLTNWLDILLQKKQYSEPPITASFSC